MFAIKTYFMLAWKDGLICKLNTHEQVAIYVINQRIANDCKNRGNHEVMKRFLDNRNKKR